MFLDFTSCIQLLQAIPQACNFSVSIWIPGSNGLHRLLAERPGVTAAAIASNIEKHPELYEDARRCVAVLSVVRQPLLTPLDRFRSLYTDAQFPPITIVVSRGKPAAIADSSGVIVSIETMCAVTWMNPNLEGRFVQSIAHEYVHVQQALAVPAFYANPKPTVLQASLIEGAAEFVSELTGEPGEVHSAAMLAATKGREADIETRFSSDERQTDLSDWIDNSTMTNLGDLGYWVGYRVVKSYYEHTVDKRAEIRDIIQMNDAGVFLSKSGWYPGMRL